MYFLDIIKVIILGIIEGITEWLPVSSTGHLIIFEQFLDLKTVSSNYMQMFRVVIQLGAILAVVLLYFRTLNPFSPKKNIVQKKETWSLWFKVIVATLPAVIIGLPFDDYIDKIFYNPLTIAITLVLYGILFILIEKQNRIAKVTKLSDLTYSLAFAIGVVQVLALLPGTSRSGSTILGALILGCARPVAAKFSFFLAIPVMFGASGLKLVKYMMVSSFTFGEIFLLLVGMIISFIVSVFAINFLMNYVKKHTFTHFGYYRIALGVLVLIIFSFMGKLL